MSDLEQLIRNIVRDEIARAVANDDHSRRPSTTGVGSPGQGDQECSREFMDRTNTETGGESKSLREIEEQGRLDIARLIRGSRPTPTSTARETKRRATQSGKR